MKTDIIIYSKDRPAQCDLLVRSIRQFFQESKKIYILFDYSSDYFKQGYDKIVGAELVRQTPNTFKNIMVSTLKKIKTKFVLPLCDDDVFINTLNLDTFERLYNSNVVGLNLRYSPNITLSYHDGSQILPPFFTQKLDILEWDWTLSNQKYAWGYPYQAGSVIYETTFFESLVKKLEYTLPGPFESSMNANKFVFGKNKLFCFNTSKLINVSVNRVDTIYNNRAGRDVSISVNDLNRFFLEGKQINLESVVKLCQVKNSCDFIEIPFEMIDAC